MIISVTHSATWKRCVEEDYSQGCRPGGRRPRVGDRQRNAGERPKRKKYAADEKRDV